MNVHFDSVIEAGRKLRSGEVGSLELTELMLQRIESLNGKLNAYITVTSELAREQARRADEELAQGTDRGPLHGIPVAIKDLFDTAGVRTTCGSKLFENRVPDRDAAAVARLFQAGAVMLGKTNMDELAYGTCSINPWFGPVRNPWALDHDSGGSSGGSAAAVAAGLAYAALGSDTGCSIRQPAHCCGVVGFKPSFGAVSKAGALPLVWSMDHVGPLARSAGDAAAMFGALVGHDPADPYSSSVSPCGGFEAGRERVNGLRVGVVRRFFFEGHADVIRVVDDALDRLRDHGAVIMDLDIPDLEDAHAAARTTFVEATAVHEDDLRERADAFSDEVRAKIEAALETRATKYARAQHFRRGFTNRVEQLLSECVVLACPTATIAAAPFHGRPEDYGLHSWKNTGIFNLTGHPSVSVPCGFTRNGLPVGLMLTSGLFSNWKLLEIADACEGVLGQDGVHPSL
jgi:aspartyl-tRNA(Asn)/glutamyl-tRNA(Gln) amidotransferase subunit A